MSALPPEGAPEGQFLCRDRPQGEDLIIPAQVTPT